VKAEAEVLVDSPGSTIDRGGENTRELGGKFQTNLGEVLRPRTGERGTSGAAHKLIFCLGGEGETSRRISQGRKWGCTGNSLPPVAILDSWFREAAAGRRTNYRLSR